MKSNPRSLVKAQALGYTEREAAFLQLVVEHSGYFLPRQVDRFYGQPRGQVRTRFLERLVAHKDAAVSTTVRQTSLFHVCGRALYRALGEEDNRNRRRRPPHLIRSRLMTLDFVLTHPEYVFLPYGDARAGYFVQVHEIDLGAVPTKRYLSPTGAPASLRYFVDKFPAYRVAGEAALWFCYIDEGGQTSSGFETYLRQYEALFHALPTYRVAYVVENGSTCGSGPLSVFRRWRANGDTGIGRVGGEDVASLRDHFQRRLWFETGQHRLLSRADLTALRAELRQFQGERYDRLFSAWKLESSSLGNDGAALAATDCDSDPQFTISELPYRYDLFQRDSLASVSGRADRTNSLSVRSTDRSTERSTSSAGKAQ
jgi:hypothetical protein